MYVFKIKVQEILEGAQKSNEKRTLWGQSNGVQILTESFMQVIYLPGIQFLQW